MKEFIDILSTNHLEIGIQYRPSDIGLGVCGGNNSKRGGKPCNVYIEINVLFWTLEIEIMW